MLLLQHHQQREVGTRLGSGRLLDQLGMQLLRGRQEEERVRVLVELRREEVREGREPRVTDGEKGTDWELSSVKRIV